MATSGEEGLHKRSRLAKNRLKLCDLPDEILIRIISLLPTTDGVATSILSRRWRYLCMSITKLEFCEEDSFIRVERRRRQFMNYVDRVMIPHDRSSLASLSLSWSVLGDTYRVSRWITSAIRCNIKELSLQLDNCPSSYRLPVCIFSCESLVKLELNVRSCVLAVPSSISLPNVKYLELDYVNFDNDESAEKLLSLPSLEELHIRGRGWRSTRSLSVTFPKLRVLKLHDEGNTELAKDIDRKIRFSGDSLEYFRFTGFPSSDYYICGSAVQLKAEILVEDILFCSRQENMYIAVKRCYKLLSGLSRVRSLTLTEDFLQFLEKASELVDTLPVFEYVVQLNLQAYNLTTGVRIDSLMIMKIYERCPHLEHLNFMHVLSNGVSGTILQPMPSCFQTHLKRITIVDYKPEKQGNAIQALLNSAPILEEVIVVYRRPSTVCPRRMVSEFQIQKFEDEINDRPRASKDCRISVVFYRG